jgi:hypothetical protein
MTMFEIVFYPHCGDRLVLAESVDREEAGVVVRGQLLASRRLGLIVSKLSPGRWEIEGPDDAVMVSDREGILVARRCRAGRKR